MSVNFTIYRCKKGLDSPRDWQRSMHSFCPFSYLQSPYHFEVCTTFHLKVMSLNLIQLTAERKSSSFTGLYEYHGQCILIHGQQVNVSLKAALWRQRWSEIQDIEDISLILSQTHCVRWSHHFSTTFLFEIIHSLGQFCHWPHGTLISAELAASVLNRSLV